MGPSELLKTLKRCGSHWKKMSRSWESVMDKILPLLGVNEPLNKNSRFDSASEFLEECQATSIGQFIQDEKVLKNYILFLRVKRYCKPLSFGINIVGPPIPFYIAIGALTNQAIRRSLIDTRSPGPSAIVKRRRENLGCEKEMSFLDPIIIMRNTYTDSRQKWLRYRLATSSLFLSKSRANPEDQVCHWCKEVKETSFHFFYFCQKILPVIRAVEEEIVRAYGTTLEPSDWLISTSPRYGKAFHIEHIISSVQGLLYACRVNGRCIPAGIRKYVVQSIETLRSATT
ncbi:Uncharacterized protein FKW44_013723 [Caligus rogercresseyi]|uniref:Uncharacterized protein n=2 Tax=Caligus rogercresseyi TaxID=217165 RepID=A0A7T8GYS1_CALRO|nr:Uncharacterized protein FKW44_013723 [Caligus rogercresseyi]